MGQSDPSSTFGSLADDLKKRRAIRVMTDLFHAPAWSVAQALFRDWDRIRQTLTDDEVERYTAEVLGAEKVKVGT